MIQVQAPLLIALPRATSVTSLNLGFLISRIRRPAGPPLGAHCGNSMGAKHEGAGRWPTKGKVGREPCAPARRGRLLTDIIWDSWCTRTMGTLTFGRFGFTRDFCAHAALEGGQLLGPARAHRWRSQGTAQVSYQRFPPEIQSTSHPTPLFCSPTTPAFFPELWQPSHVLIPVLSTNCNHQLPLSPSQGA